RRYGDHGRVRDREAVMVYHVIAMDNICKHYEPAPGVITPVLKSVDLTIEPGEFVSIMGPSGSGKSTLMNIIGTLDKSSSGTYMLDDANISDYDDEEMARIRNTTIGFVF